MAEMIRKKQVLRAVRARLPILGDRKLEMSLEHAAGSLAEAYRIGAEEAQHVIAVRIEALTEKRPASKVRPIAADSEVG